MKKKTKITKPFKKKAIPKKVKTKVQRPECIQHIPMSENTLFDNEHAWLEDEPGIRTW